MKHKPGELIQDYRPIINKYPYVRSRKLLDSSRDRVCTFNFQGCNYDSSTTVACHANYDFCGKGTSIKASDIFSADGCSYCHDIYDGRAKSNYTDQEKQWFFWRAFVKTLNRRISEGYVTIKGVE